MSILYCRVIKTKMMSYITIILPGPPREIVQGRTNKLKIAENTPKNEKSKYTFMVKTMGPFRDLKAPSWPRGSRPMYQLNPPLIDHGPYRKCVFDVCI